MLHITARGDPSVGTELSPASSAPGEKGVKCHTGNLLPHTERACLALQRRLHLENSRAHFFYGIRPYLKLVDSKTVIFCLRFQLRFVPETFRVKTVLQLNVIFIALIHFLNLILISERLSNKCTICKKSVKVCLRGGYGEKTYRNALLPTSHAATFYVPPNSWLQKLLQIQLSCTAWGISERDHPGGC